MNRDLSSKPYICILDAHTTQLDDLNWDSLKSLGNLEVFARTAAGETVERCQGKEILITNKVVLGREQLSQLPDCKLICLLSTGTNAVDVDCCRELNIPVCNIPAYSRDSVAELVFALLFEWAREVSTHSRAVLDGKWSACEDFCFQLTPQRELRGMTLGLLGFGEIAQAVGRIGSALGMKLLAHTPHPDGKPDLGQEFVSLENLFAVSDVLSLHCPLTPETDRLVNAERLECMKDGALLINTGRGGLLDETAVAEALRSGKLAAALLDVLSTEPPAPDNPLLHAPRTVITPHIAWATRAARARLIGILTGNIEGYLTGNLRNVVNPR